MNTDTEKINIFMNIDDNYAVPAYISLFSLIHNHHNNEDVVAYILNNNELSLKNHELLESLSSNNNHFTVVFIDMGNEYSDVTINIDHITYAAMYRLMIPRIVKKLHLKIEKCIYLDTDIVVEGDISELYNIDSEWDAYYCAGVLDPCCFEEKYKNYEKKLNIPSMDRYINSGVLLLNIKKIEKDGLGDELINAGYRNDFLHNDQDAINTVFYNGIKTIPLKYNMMRTVFYHNNNYISYRYGESETIDSKKHPYIIHFIDHQKPWSHKTILMADMWWKYVKIQNSEIQKLYIDPFTTSHAASLSEILFEATKTSFALFGVYDVAGSIKKKLQSFI